MVSLILCMEEPLLPLLSLAAAALHEGGHLLACRMVSVPVLRLRLTCCGGELIPLRHLEGREECLVAMAGPAVNLLLSAGFAAFADEEQWAVFSGVNLILGLFNLLPMLPLDGGRILHGILSCIMKRGDATQALLLFSNCLLIMGLLPAVYLAMLGNMSLLMVVGCLWFAGRREY